LNDLRYTEDDYAFAARIQQSLEQPKPLESIAEVERLDGVGMGSTDVGDVSWVVPTAGFTTACFVPGTPGHSWQAVACGGTEIAHRGMNLGARVLAATAWDLYHDPNLLAAGQEERKRLVGEAGYATLMQEGQKPPLDYREPPQAAVAD
jgi:aminobenzoyl-glutamate utilization protein B